MKHNNLMSVVLRRNTEPKDSLPTGISLFLLFTDLIHWYHKKMLLPVLEIKNHWIKNSLRRTSKRNHKYNFSVVLRRNTEPKDSDPTLL